MNAPSLLRRVSLLLRLDQVESLDEAARTDGAGNRSTIARQVIDLGLAELRRLAGQANGEPQS
jgi:metal-responsive CopG/Arc/MetJ family transcriptional regulator